MLHKNAREQLPATDSLACMCTLTNGGCDENCQNRLMQQEGLPSLCLCGDLCANRPFARHHANPLPLQLFKTAYKGWGVKLEQSCTKGDLLNPSPNPNHNHNPNPNPNPNPSPSPSPSPSP